MSTFRYDNIELWPLIINNTQEVNPQPMDDVQCQVVNGELMIFMRGHVGPNGELPGALIGFTLPVINTILGKQMIYAGLNHEMKIDEVSNANLQAWESDLKWCIAAATDPNTPIKNVVDGSVQKVGASWQIDDATQRWRDIGFNTIKFPANQWNRIATRMTVNPSTSQFSVTSITDGGATYKIPAGWNAVPLQNLPLLQTNWTATGVQLQMCLSKTGFAIVCVRNISALFSDAPIPATV